MMRCWTCHHLVMVADKRESDASTTPHLTQSICLSCGATYKITTEFLGIAIRKEKVINGEKD